MKKSYFELQNELIELIRFQDMNKLKDELSVRYRVSTFHKLNLDQLQDFVTYLQEKKPQRNTNPIKTAIAQSGV